MKSQQPLACVLGDMDLVRPLGQAGIPCAVVDRRDPGIYSRFTRMRIRCGAEPGADPEGFLAGLVRFAESQPERPVLFYESDPVMLLICRHRDRLSRAFSFCMAETELVEDLADKARFQALAERLGLPVPRARRLAPGAALDPDLRFPLIVKPTLRCLEVWEPLAGESKAVLAESLEALGSIRSKAAAAGLELVVQEYVPGPESCIESYHVYVDERGEIAGEFTGRKLRTFPLENGWSAALTITDAADVAELGREIVRRLGLTGVAKLDFKRAPDGRLHLLEVNPRFNLWHHPGAAAGVNLPALVYADLTGRVRPPVARARAGVRWCSLGDDLRAARAIGMPLHRWLGWMLTCETRSAVAWDDPMPLVRGVLWPAVRRRALGMRRAGAAGARVQAPQLPGSRGLDTGSGPVP